MANEDPNIRAKATGSMNAASLITIGAGVLVIATAATYVAVTYKQKSPIHHGDDRGINAEANSGARPEGSRHVEKEQKVLFKTEEYLTGGDRHSRYTDKMILAGKDGFSREVPFDQLNIEIRVLSGDSPEFYWTFMPISNATEAVSSIDAKKGRMEWRRISPGGTTRSSIMGQEAAKGGAFIFWNQHYSKSVRFEAVAIGMYSN